jgi:hypothetical protein
MGRSNRNQTFERARWHQVDCDYGCRASRLESATALRNSASFRDYGPANGGQQTFDQVRAGAPPGRVNLPKSFFVQLSLQRLVALCTIFAPAAIKTKLNNPESHPPPLLVQPMKKSATAR